MISEIVEFENECIKSFQTIEKSNSEFKKNKQELEVFNLKANEYLRQYTISDEKVSAALTRAIELAIKAKQDLAKLEITLLQEVEVEIKNSIISFQLLE